MDTEIFSAEEAQKRLRELPPEVSKLIYSAEMTDIIEAIGKKHNLYIDKIGNLESEASFLMLGFTKPKDFAQVLEERLPTDAATAASIVEDVNEQLLSKVRSTLKNLYPNSLEPKITSTIEARGDSPITLAERLAHAPEPVIPGTPIMTPPAALSSVDHTLHESQSAPAEKIDVAPHVAPTPYSKDPYREEI